jgi:hypothetical protein
VDAVSEPAWIPFSVSTRRPLLVVPVLLDGQGPFRFAVDTGASASLVTPRVARRLGLDRGRSARAIGAGGPVDVSFSTVRVLKVGVVEVRDAPVVIMKLGPVNKVVRPRLHGVIGFDVLKHCRLTVDYPSGRLLLEPGDAG